MLAHLDFNLSDGVAFEPVSLAPDLWYGASDKLSVGLAHSGLAVSGFWGGAGTGLCFTGEDKGCVNTYSNAALQVRYDLGSKVNGLAVEGGLIVRDFDPFVLAGKVGVVYVKELGSLQAMVSPNFQFGMSERDAGNKEFLNVPLSLLYKVKSRVGVGVQTGVALPLSNSSDLWRLPLSLVGQALVSERYYLFGAFTLTALAGGDLLATGVDGRVLSVGAGASL